MLPGALAAADGQFQFTDSKGQPVADAVISLTPLDGTSAPAPAAGTTVEIAQEDKQFTPRVAAIRAGTAVTFTNRETKGVQHQIYSLSEARPFEIPLHKPGNSSPVVFEKPGVVVVGCNIHDWMNAYVVVLATPWFAQSAPTGAATIAGAPAGRYRADVWHARQQKPASREIALPAEAPIAFTLALKPEPRRRPLPEAGGGYK